MTTALGSELRASKLTPTSSLAMAPHLDAREQDAIFAAMVKKKSVAQIHDMLAKRRHHTGVSMVNITVVRRFVRGKTHHRGGVETRGRKRVLTRRNVLAMDSARRKLIKATRGEQRLKWDTIRVKGRAPHATRTTVARAFAREGIDVKLRRAREKPQRTEEMERERAEVCGNMRRWPLSRFTDGIDMIIDNKKFDVPTTPDARHHLATQKLVAQLRTRSEGLQEHFTKPNQKAHRTNLGGTVNVCAGISNCRVVLWEYYTKWNGQVAADMYKGPILKSLIKKRGRKAKYLLAEDNDPTGYKSGKAIAEKKRLGIQTLDWPRYSPDLMPLDFSLWADISKRVEAGAPRGKETVDEFKKRLRRVALQTSGARVRSAVEAMRTRAAQIWEHAGKDIPRD